VTGSGSCCRGLSSSAQPESRQHVKKTARRCQCAATLMDSPLPATRNSLTAGDFEGRDAVGQWFADRLTIFEPGHHLDIEEAQALGAVVFLVASHTGVDGRAASRSTVAPATFTRCATARSFVLSCSPIRPQHSRPPGSTSSSRQGHRRRRKAYQPSSRRSKARSPASCISPLSRSSSARATLRAFHLLRPFRGVKRSV
jgi:hypothetical protein